MDKILKNITLTSDEFESLKEFLKSGKVSLDNGRLFYDCIKTSSVTFLSISYEDKIGVFFFLHIKAGKENELIAYLESVSGENHSEEVDLDIDILSVDKEDDNYVLYLVNN